MAFPTGWNRKCAITIDSTMVSSGSLSDFPVLLTEGTLPSEMLDSDGSYPAQSDAGDIRFSSDSAGSSQLACEVVSFTTAADPANGEAEIWVKVPSVTASGDTTIYVWYSTAGTTSKETDSGTYGRDSVWAAYTAVWHLDATGSQTDSTGNSHTLTESGTPSSTDAPWAASGNGGALSMDGSGGDKYAAGAAVRGNSSFTASMWFQAPASLTNGDGFLDDGSSTSGGFQVLVTGNKARFRLDDSGSNGGVIDTATSINDNTWRLYHVVADKSASAQQYLNGSSNGGSLTISGYGDISPTLNFQINQRDAFSQSPVLLYDEVRVIESVLTSVWMLTEHTNQDAPATYITAGTPVDAGGGGGGATIPIFARHYMNMRAA